MTNAVKVCEFSAAIRGYHYYKRYWSPRESEVLHCSHEFGNVFDIFAIKTCNSKGEIVGHLPREISRVSKYVLDRGASIKATLTSSNYRRSPLVQGGLEIACIVTVKMPATIKNHMLVEKYMQIVNELYAEPKEEIILGSFLKKSRDAITEPVTAKKNNGKESLIPKKKPRKDRDIRTILLPVSKKENRPEQNRPTETSRPIENDSVIIIDA